MTAMPQAAPIGPTLTLDEPRDPRGLGGLIAQAAAGEVALPLKSVTVRASIAGDCCRTIVEQRFHNTLDQPMEAIHIFPLPDDGAVTAVELRCGEIIVKAECKEKQEAEAEFAEARAAGHRAALLTADRDDVHTLRVTNLPPGEEVSVRIVVVERLDSVDGTFRWRFPTTIPPRYLPGEAISHTGRGVLPDTTAAPDASRLQPPLLLEGGTALDIEVAIDGSLTSLESSLHAVRIAMGDGIRIAPSGNTTCNKDFVLAFSTAADNSTGVRAYTDGSHTVVVVEPPSVDMPTALPRDAVFIVDISGSMGGTKMDAAKSALHSALHGLLPGDRFQLIAFDDRVERFAKGFTAYDDRSLAKADRWIGNLTARGGTEMLPAIQAGLEGETEQGRLRTVLFITDGQSWNEAQLVAAVANRRGQARFFTLGIDTAVNSSLLKKLASVGGGTCELASPRDDIEGVVANLEARFGSPVVEGLGVEGFSTGRLRKAVLFSGRPASLIIEGAPDVVTVTGNAASGDFRVEAKPTKVDFPIGALWARARVAGLQERLMLKPFEEEALRPEILKVALAHGIASRFTAFIAVERTVAVDGDLAEVVQPNELPEEWDESFRNEPTGGMPMMRSMAAPAPPPPAAPYPQSPSPVAKSAMRSGSRKKKRKAGRPRKVAEESAAELRPVMDSAVFVAEAESEPMANSGPGIVRALASGIAGAIGGLMGGSADGFSDLDDEEGEEDDSVMFFGRDKPADSRTGDLAHDLARAQGADGSFGSDITKTVAALIALVLLGHTRRRGTRRRTVLKAASWLAAHKGDAAVDEALGLLARAEKGESVTHGNSAEALTSQALA